MNQEPPTYAIPTSIVNKGPITYPHFPQTFCLKYPYIADTAQAQLG